MTVRRRLKRLLALLGQRRLDRDLDDAVTAPLEMAERDGVAAGLSPAGARARARREFGHIEPMREAHRDGRSARWIEHMLKDVRYGTSRLVRDPGFTCIAIGVLALGIGATAAMFSLMDAVLLKPLPFPHAERIVRVWEAPRPGVSNSTSTPDFLDWKRLGSSFEYLAAERSMSQALTGLGAPVRLEGKRVTPDYFKIFETVPARGRVFIPGDDDPGTPPSVVLSHAAWQTFFGGDPDILTRHPMFDGQPHRVIGVLPPGVFDRDQSDFWTPLVFGPDRELRSSHWLTVHGLLHSNVPLENARQEMPRIDSALDEVTAAYKRPWTIAVEPLEGLLVNNSLRQSIVVAFGAVAMVLLIACANVANLLLAKGATRRKEMALRAALGAGRGRLVAQMFTESLVLCIAGGAAGIGIAALLMGLATPVIADSIPHTAEVGLDMRVLTFVAAVALLVGTLPALQTSFVSLTETLNRSARGSSGRNGVRRAVVIVEVALSLVLVSGAALLFKSLHKLQQLDTGVRIENVLTTSIDLPLHAYPTPESAARFYDSIVDQVRAAPGVERAALASHLPLQWISNGEGVRVPGLDDLVNVRFKRVDASYFQALGISMAAGRRIEARDGWGAPPVVVINEALAARLVELVGMNNPIGQIVGLRRPDYATGQNSPADTEIIGVIRSERVGDPWNDDPPVVYVPIAQVPQPGFRLVVSTRLAPDVVLPGIRDAVRRADPRLPLGQIATLKQVQQRTLSFASRPAWAIGAFAATAAALAALGLYGVLAHAVSQRRREIGIRMALGARTADILRGVVTHALWTVAVGLGIGLVGAYATTRVMGNLLFQVSPLDPFALSLACGSMLLVGLLATLVPARRAVMVNPVTVLQDEG